MFFFVGFKIHGDLSICDHRQIKECLNISARIKLVNKPFKTHGVLTIWQKNQVGVSKA